MRYAKLLSWVSVWAWCTVSAATAYAQPGGGGVGGIAANAFPRQVTVAQLPAVTGTNGMRIVTDALSTASCLVAGGTAKVVCLDNGVTWEAIGSGDADTTCLDAGVTCLFAASATEGGAASDVSCTDCVAGTDLSVSPPTAY